MENNKNDVVVSQPEFADAIPVMYAPLQEYVGNIIPLMLQHAWQQKKINNRSSEEELMQSGWIGRLITLDKRVMDRDRQDEIAGWPATRNYLVRCLDDCNDESVLAAMADNCMKVVRPIVEKRFIGNYHFPARMFHCWWYTIHDNDTHVALHLINAYQPDSPFDHLDHFLTSMLQAVEHALAAYPTIKIVSCGSWLNQLKKFQQLWPESFRSNQMILNETGGFGPGAWGQYMTTSGGFNKEKAGILRTTGKHPFALTEAKCPVTEMIAHVKRLLS